VTNAALSVVECHFERAEHIVRTGFKVEAYTVAKKVSQIELSSSRIKTRQRGSIFFVKFECKRGIRIVKVGIKIIL